MKAETVSKESVPPKGFTSESSRPVRQCELRKLHQDAEAGRNLRSQIREPGTFTNQHRRIHRRVLQSAALTFCAWLSIAGRIRAQVRRPGRKSRRNDRGFCEQRQRRKDFERAAGDGDSDAVPFPRPLLLLEDARTLLQKRKLCPKNLCHERGSPHKLGNNLGTNAAEYRTKLQGMT